MNKKLADVIVAKIEKVAMEELEKQAAVNPQLLKILETAAKGGKLPISLAGAGIGAGAGAIADKDSAGRGALIGGGIGALTPVAGRGISKLLEKTPAGTAKGFKKTPAASYTLNDLVNALASKKGTKADITGALGAAGKSQAPAKALITGAKLTGAGAVGGAITGEDNKDRLRRALIGGTLGAGVGAGGAAGKLLGRSMPLGTRTATGLAGAVGGGIGGHAAAKSVTGKKK